MAESLKYIRDHAAFPPTVESKEDQNSVGECPISSDLIDSLKTRVSSVLPQTSLKIFLLDGFLLYPPSMAPIHPYINTKLFLRTSYAKAKARREARTGYVTIEGFWEDPPGYVDKIVWPNYVEEHGYMFENGDVEGKFRHDVLERERIRVEDEGGVGEGDMGRTLEWSVGILLDEIKQRA